MGLNAFHLRKPNWTIAQYEAYLAQFSVSQRKRIHVHAAVSDRYEIAGQHLRETDWRKLSESDWKVLRKTADEKGETLSASLHSLEQSEWPLHYADYVFLSPVYDSISKKDYKASEKIWEEMKSKAPTKAKLIALGGIRIENYEAISAAGFDGLAVLGAFWASETLKEDLAVYWNKAAQLFAK